MTASVRTRSARVKPEFPLPVRSVCEGTAFLVLEECANGRGVVVRRSSRYGGKLNRFWTVWVREQLLKLDVKYGVRITINRRGVRVVSDCPVEEWVWAASHLLAHVVPIEEQPLRPYYWHGRVYEGYWNVKPGVDLTEIIEGITLPDGMARFFELVIVGCGERQSVHIHRYGIHRKKCTFTDKEVSLMVELQVALAWRKLPSSPE